MTLFLKEVAISTHLAQKYEGFAFEWTLNFCFHPGFVVNRLKLMLRYCFLSPTVKHQ